MKLSILAGSTSQTINVFVRDSSSTTGGGLTGLAFNTASLTAYYALPKAAAVSITLATLAAVTSAYSSGGFKEVDATNMPGWYRFDIPDAALASGRFVSIHFKGATNMAPLPIEIELTAVNNQSATSFITAVNGVAQTGDAYARLGAPAGASVSADVAAVNAKTTNLPGDPADASDIAGAFGTVNATLSTIAGYLDTEIAAIKTVTDALPNAGALTTIQADLDDIQTRIPAALASGNMKVDLLAIGGDTSALTAFKRAVLGNVIGTCAALGTTTSIITSALTPAGAAVDQFKGRILTFDKDTTTTALRGQSTDITASTNSATPTMTVTALTTAPVSGDTFTVT